MWYKFSKFLFASYGHFLKLSNFEEAVKEIEHYISSGEFIKDIDKTSTPNVSDQFKAYFFNVSAIKITTLHLNTDKQTYDIPVYAMIDLNGPREASILTQFPPYIIVFVNNITNIRSTLAHEISHLYEFLRKYENTQLDGLRKEKSFFHDSYRQKIMESNRSEEEKQNLIHFIKYVSLPSEVRARIDEIFSNPETKSVFKSYLDEGDQTLLAIEKTAYKFLGDDYKYMPTAARNKLNTELYKYLYSYGRGKDIQ